MKLKVLFGLLFHLIYINGIMSYKVKFSRADKHTLMARYIINNVGWATISTTSVMSEIKSFPYANLVEIVDGLDDKGNGIPYFYVVDFDPLTIDTAKDDRCTLLASLAETEWCKEKRLEEQDPRCARLMISGRFVRVNKTTEEYTSALQHVHKKHPQTIYWPGSHQFYIAKMDIQHINLFDSFGGLKTINVKEYLTADEEFGYNI